MTDRFGPGPIDRSEAASDASPVAASPGRHFGAQSYARPLAGLATVAVVAVIFAVAVGLFQGSFTETVPVTVISQRAGLVMNPDAKVKMRGVQVGKVAVDRIAAQRPSGDSLGDGPVAVALHSRQRAGRHRVIDGVRREVHPAGRTCPALGAAATRWPDAAGPARHGRNQHGVPAIGVGSVPHRPAEAQRVTGCAGTSVQWAGRKAWPIPERLGFVPGQAGAEPSRIPS